MINSNKTIVVIGPVYPYKGGIAHYTGLMVRALSSRFNVRTISYSMQYPKLLFKREQKDYENDSFKVDADFILNTAYVPSILKTAKVINSIGPELVIIQWWHPYFAPCYSILAGRLKARVLFICHNVFPHERFFMDRLLTRLTLRKGDCFILHSQRETAELKSIIPDPLYRVNMHPTYEEFNFSGGTEDNTKGRSLLFFGFVRPYKGLAYLLEALPDTDPDIRLMIVGDFGKERERYNEIISRLRLTDRVEIHDEYVPDREVERYFKACDAVVLPYVEATQSGIAQIAYGFKKPVIATDAGGLPEVVTDSVTGVICKRADSKELSEAIRRFYELKDKVDFKGNIEKDAYRFSWDHLVDTIVEMALQ